MKSKKVFILVLALGILALVGAYWTGRANAQAVSSPTTIVDKLVERFSLNKDEVTGVFDEIHQEHQQQRQAYMESKLDEAVEDGVITAEQKQALSNKHREMQEKRNQEREEMQRWMEESGIDFGKLAPYKVGYGGRGFGGGPKLGGF